MGCASDYHLKNQPLGMVSGGEGMRHGCREGVIYGREAMSWCQFQCVSGGGRGGEFPGEWGCN